MGKARTRGRKWEGDIGLSNLLADWGICLLEGFPVTLGVCSAHACGPFLDMNLILLTSGLSPLREDRALSGVLDIKNMIGIAVIGIGHRS